MADAAPATAAAPQRGQQELHDELHARPALPVTDACVVSYWAQRGLPADMAEAALRLACAAAGQAAPPAGVRHHMLDVGAWALKYERHGEFVSWQVRCAIDPELPLAHWLAQADARHALPDGFLSAIAATPMLAATHVLVWPASEDTALPQARHAMGQSGCAAPAQAHGHSRAASRPSADLLGAWIADRRAALLTHLTLDAGGFTRFVLLDMQLSAQQRSREVQRAVEIEGYRSLAMLGFPVAQQEAHALADMEQRLLQAVDQLRHAPQPQADTHDAAACDQQVFASLVELASQVEHAAARSRYRFSATRAYHRIVQRRLIDLNEERISGIQTLGSFLARRFTPAMEFCDSTDARLNDVAARVQRAVNLVQVRIESQREADNQLQLQALARRQHLQLRLQQTVEGLSVVAISYYAVSLLAYVFKLLKTIPAIEALHIPVEAAVGASVIPVVLLVAWGVRRIRLHHDTD